MYAHIKKKDLFTVHSLNSDELKGFLNIFFANKVAICAVDIPC